MNCEVCGQDMSHSDGCTEHRYTFKTGEVFEAQTYRPIRNQRCPDCNCLPDHYHHAGCDQERCPRCGFQMIACDCDMLNLIVGETSAFADIPHVAQLAPVVLHEMSVNDFS